MILHPGILGLLLTAVLVLGMALIGAYAGAVVLARWDLDSSAEGQLALERKTYLLSTLMGHALALEVVSMLVFLYTLDDIHPIFAGAMCATGTLNANPVGWWALAVKLVALFCCALWIALNRIDQRAEDYPLTRLKYGLLLLLAPLLAWETWLLLRFFTGLDPHVITSCCGASFSGSGAGIAAEVAGLPVLPLMVAFFGGVLLYLGLGVLVLRRAAPRLSYALAALAAAMLGIALASVIAFISSYHYQLPTHHCPFCLLQPDYRYVGYPMYLALFGAVFYGLMVGIAEPLKRIPSIQGTVAAAQPRWTRLSMLLLALFVAIAVWPMLVSDFTLGGY
jgi:hypothetical protein